MGLRPSKVDDLTASCFTGAGLEEGIDNIVDEVIVSQLLTVAPDLDLFAVQGLADEPTESGLPAMFHQHSRPVGIGHAQGAGANAMHIIV